MTNWSKADTKNEGKNHILTQFLTLQTSNFTLTQNVINIVHFISANQIGTIFIINKMQMGIHGS